MAALSPDVTINDRTREALRQIDKLSVDRFTEFVGRILEIAKQPYNKETGTGGAPFITGNLRNSLASIIKELMEWWLVSQTGYGGIVHVGTADRQGNPFFARATQTATPEFLRSGPWG